MSKITLNKSDLVRRIAEKLNARQTEIGAVIDAVIDEIRTETANGQIVNLAGLGKFEQRARSARMGRNPRTGEAVEIPASTVLAFKPGKARQ